MKWLDDEHYFWFLSNSEFNFLMACNMASKAETCPSIFVQFCRFLTFGLCIGGFAWLCWGQVAKFLSDKTTVTVSWNKSNLMPFPVIVFCPQDAFKTFVPLHISEGIKCYNTIKRFCFNYIGCTFFSKELKSKYVKSRFRLISPVR